MPETGLSEVASSSPRKGRRKWYTNIGILLTILISLIAVSMAALMLLLLPQSSEIIRFMQWRMINAKSYYVAANVSYAGGLARKDANGATRRSDEAVTFSSEGWFDRRDAALPKTRQKFDLKWGKTDPLPFAGDYARAAD